MMPDVPEREWASEAALTKLAFTPSIRCWAADCQVINNAAFLAFFARVYRVIVLGRSFWTKRIFTMASVNSETIGIKFKHL